jgi:hypothetical protein
LPQRAANRAAKPMNEKAVSSGANDQFQAAAATLTSQ